MTGRIPRYFIDDLLARVDIVDLIDKHVPLKKAGANYVARCPFHSEKTPSFSVNRNKQFFHCFGCGASGNAIGFLMDFNHLDFIEAVEDLATFAGLEVPREAASVQLTQPKNENVTDIYLFLEDVAALYVQYLRSSEEGKQAVSYLRSRGVDDRLAKDFMLGYAPEEWRFLSNRFGRDLLLGAGMAVDKDGKNYDRFRGRIMFPIRDKRGRVVGFGGRVLDDGLPKYLNSPETSVFHKSKEVYGLYELLREDSKPKKILVVEGYLDVIALAGHGIHFAVATLGTATSQAHLDLLFRFSSELIFCFDGDNAGREAAWRAMEPAFGSLKDGRQVRILVLPPNHDPDSLVREEGAENFEKRIMRSQALSDYFFNALSDGLKLDEMEGRSQLAAKAKPYMDKLTLGVFRDMMFAKLEQLTGAKLDVSAISTRLSPNKDAKSSLRHGLQSKPRRALALLVQFPHLIGLAEKSEIKWDGLDVPGIQVFREIYEAVLKSKPTNTAMLLEQFRGHPLEKTVKELASLKLFEADQVIEESGVEAEFHSALDYLLSKAWADSYNKLIAKGKYLDQAEKELLRKLFSLKQGGVF